MRNLGAGRFVQAEAKLPAARSLELLSLAKRSASLPERRFLPAPMPSSSRKTRRATVNSVSIPTALSRI